MANILIIDDSISVRSHLGDVLRKAGHNVTEGADGRDGLKKLTTQAPLDLVITDYKMPGYDGLVMLEHARAALGGKFPFPIFMLTTETSEKLKDDGKKVGVVAWIIKPFVEEKLLQAITRALALKKPA